MKKYFVIASLLIGISLFGSNCEGAIECAEVDLTKVDKELNNVYKKLNTKLNNQQKEALKKAQRAWLQYRDSDLEFSSSLPSTAMGQHIIANELYEKTVKTQHRVNELTGYLSTF